MFRKTLLALALALALAVPAAAADNGFYMGLKFIDSIQSTGPVSKGGGANFFEYFAGLDLKGQWGLQTLFLNAYWDFHNDSAFTPYIGAGLGMGFISNRYEVEFGNESESVNELNTVFAWNAGAGVAYAITDNLSADLAYRFVGLGYNETEKTIDGEKCKFGTSPYANQFSLGNRYTF